jgi:hypothetical protein
MALINQVQNRYKLTCRHSLNSLEQLEGNVGQFVSQAQAAGWVVVNGIEDPQREFVLSPESKAMYDEDPETFTQQYLEID